VIKWFWHSAIFCIDNSEICIRFSKKPKSTFTEKNKVCLSKQTAFYSRRISWLK
jgi:hypothetical protein